jgi:hypothetical protein
MHRSTPPPLCRIGRPPTRSRSWSTTPYSPDLAPADFFLFRRVKEELAGIRLTPESLKKSWEGVLRTIGADEFAAAFRRWVDRCNKCVRVNGGYVEKS